MTHQVYIRGPEAIGFLESKMWDQVSISTKVKLLTFLARLSSESDSKFFPSHPSGHLPQPFCPQSISVWDLVEHQEVLLNEGVFVHHLISIS